MSRIITSIRNQILKCFISVFKFLYAINDSGAHTIGVAHCNAFSERIVFNNTVAQVDPTMNPTFSQTLISKCPAQADPSTTVPLDTSTPTTFDNGYFLDLQVM